MAKKNIRLNNQICLFDNKLANTFIILLYSTGIIDFFNGMLMSLFSEQTFTLGKIIRIILLLLCLSIILRSKNKVDKLIYVLITLYFVMGNIYNYLYHYEIEVLFNDIVNLSKLILILSLIICGKILIENKYLDKVIIEKIIVFNGRIISILMIITKFLGVGNNAYVGEVGFKSYFNSNNELSIVLSLVLIYLFERIYKVINHEKTFRILDIIDITLVGISLILIGSKTSYIVIIFTFILNLLRVIKFNNIDRKKIIKYLLALFIALLSIIGILFNDIMIIIGEQIHKFQTRSLLNYILSDRNLYWNQIKDQYIDGRNTTLNNLFGFTNIPNGGMTFVNIELDANVIYLNYGIIGLLIIVLFFVYILKGSKLKFSLVYPFVVIILFSLTAGHVLFGAFAGTFLALHCMMIIESKLNISKR